MLPFSYPDRSGSRRHGPQGYARYHSYRPWLRDEFTFRCAYCVIEGLTKEAKKIISVLGLDSESYVRWRQIWIRIAELALEHDHAHFVRLMGFPEDLPNLVSLRPRGGNSRPEGVDTSFYARRERGDLPSTY